MSTLDYFLKANLYSLLFVSCYWLLLRRHTFFSLNRAYLLLSVVLSLVLPLVSLPTQTVETLPVPVGVIVLPVSAIAMAPVETGPDWEQVGLFAYGLIALLLLLRLIIRTERLLRLIRQSTQEIYNDYVLVQPNATDIPTFSFFRYLVVNPGDSANKLVINHELVHIQQRHSADVVGLAVCRAVFWACPALWLIDRMLRQVHEFLADKAITQPNDYARFLVNYAFGVQPDVLANGFFNPSLIKQRVLMLHQKATTRWALGKYILILPLALGLLAMTTARDEIADLVNQATDETLTVSGTITNAVDKKPIPGAIVMVANTGKGIPTDAQGHYKLENVPKNALLSVSFVGFTTMAIPLEGRTTVDVALTPADPNELPVMGATAVYKAVKPNPTMPVRTPPTSETINGKVYTAVEEPAVFPTGIPGLMQYVAHALRYPAKAKSAGVEGNVLVEFVVLPTGAIGSAKVKKGIGSGCDEEALRVVRQMPRWLPGQQNGKPVAMQYVLPIQFSLEKKATQQTGQAPANQLNDVWVVGYEPSTPSTNSQTNTNSQGEVFMVVEQQPQFPGGMSALGHYLARNLRYPKEARQSRVQGRVFVQYVVSQTGDIRELRILKGIGSGCDEEAVRVVSQMPKWNPGKQKGKAVAVQYNLPIQFSLEKTEDKRTGQIIHEPIDSFPTKQSFLPSGQLKLSATKVTIRGTGPLGELGSEPLIILDSVQITNDKFKSLDGHSLESIQVLKGESAAMYGEKGKNGVVLITSKKK